MSFSSILFKTMIFLSVVTFLNCNFSRNAKGISNRQKEQKVISSNVLQKDESYMSQIIYGPFKILEDNSHYRIKLSVDESVQRLDKEWQSFRLRLITYKNFIKFTVNQTNWSKRFLEIDNMTESFESYLITGDFWDIVRSDSNEKWHEKHLSASSDFILDEAGKYIIYLELFNNKRRDINAVNIFLEKI